jgi:hypothetical protein
MKNTDELRKKNAEKQKRFREKMKTAGYRMIGVWVKKNQKIPTRSEIIMREECSICGLQTDNLEFHHSNYLKPLEGIWVCKKCHGNINGMISTQGLIGKQLLGESKGNGY